MAMSGFSVFERLDDLFKQPHILPQLPESAIRLISAIDEGDASNNELAKIISSDPSLVANLLRVASSAAYAGADSKPTTVQGAILRLGHRSVRSLAVAIVVQSLLTGANHGSSFNHQRFSRHSMFVALLAQHLFSRRSEQGMFFTEYSAEEVFAAAMLHDVSIGLLSRVAPKVHDTVCQHARRLGGTFEGLFKEMFHQPLASLGYVASETWGLPSIFSQTLKGRFDPTSLDHEPILRDCLVYADAIAMQQGFSYEEWNVRVEELPPVDESLIMPPEELFQVTRTIHRESCACLTDSLRAA